MTNHKPIGSLMTHDEAIEAFKSKTANVEHVTAMWIIGPERNSMGGTEPGRWRFYWGVSHEHDFYESDLR